MQMPVSHRPRGVILVQFSQNVHKGGLFISFHIRMLTALRMNYETRICVFTALKHHHRYADIDAVCQYIKTDQKIRSFRLTLPMLYLNPSRHYSQAEVGEQRQNA